RCGFHRAPYRPMCRTSFASCRPVTAPTPRCWRCKTGYSTTVSVTARRSAVSKRPASDPPVVVVVGEGWGLLSATGGVPADVAALAGLIRSKTAELAAAAVLCGNTAASPDERTEANP